MVEFEERVRQMAKGGLNALLIATGSKLRLFEKLASANESKGINAHELAESMGYRENFVREWLGGVIGAGLIDIADEEDRYYLSRPKALTLCYENDKEALALTWMIPLLAAEFDKIVSYFRPDVQIDFERRDVADLAEFHRRNARATFPLFFGTHLRPLTPVWEKAEEGIDVLEIGCGHGFMSAYLAEKYPKSRFWATDLQPVPNSQDENLQTLLPNLKYEVRDATKMPEKWTQTFDLCLAFGVIQDLGRPDLAIKEIYKILKPGGTIIMVENDLDTVLVNNARKPNAAIDFTMGLFNCLPTSLSNGTDSWGLGALWDSTAACKVFREAGYESIIYKNVGERRVYICVK